MGQLSLWVPLAYIGALVLSLSLFSSVYRKRSAKNLANTEPWFADGHPERDVYQSLVSAAASGNDIPEHILKAALLNRAMTDVKRIVQMRDDKQALQILLQKGSIGDETTARFALAEKELEAEILDVVSEANTFRQGWGQLIFPTASEMVTHLKHKDVYYAIPEERTKQVDLLTSQGKTIPKPTITLPPLFTPPGTQVTVQGPPPAAQQGAQLPPQLQALLKAQAAESNGSGDSKAATVESPDDDEELYRFEHAPYRRASTSRTNCGPRRTSSRMRLRSASQGNINIEESANIVDEDAYESFDSESASADEVPWTRSRGRRRRGRGYGRSRRRAGQRGRS